MVVVAVVPALFAHHTVFFGPLCFVLALLAHCALVAGTDGFMVWLQLSMLLWHTVAAGFSFGHFGADFVFLLLVLLPLLFRICPMP